MNPKGKGHAPAPVFPRLAGGEAGGVVAEEVATQTVTGTARVVVAWYPGRRGLGQQPRVPLPALEHLFSLS